MPGLAGRRHGFISLRPTSDSANPRTGRVERRSVVPVAHVVVEARSRPSDDASAPVQAAHQRHNPTRSRTETDASTLPYR